MSSSGTSSPRAPKRRKKVGYWFDVAAADRVCQFFELFLTHSKGEWAGRPFVLDPWQTERIIRPLFGLKRDDTGLRWYRRCDVWIPKKNGKSTLAAGIGLYLTAADGELGAEVYGVANDKDQACICWGEAARMVKKSPELSERCQVFTSTSAIVVPESNSSYQAVGSDIGDKDGINVSGAICDEIHEWRKRDLLTKLTNAQSARRQPLTFVISTAGQNLNGVGYAEYREDKRIFLGKSRIRDRLVVIFEAGPKENWRSKRTWKAANPGYGKTVKVPFLESELAVAETDPMKQGDFKRYYLNIWTGQTSSSINLEKWDGPCAGPIDRAALAGQECIVGVDLATRADLTAIAAVFVVGMDLVVLPHFFVPSEDIETKEIRDGAPYRQWARAGLMTITDGNITDYEFVKAMLLDWSRTYTVKEVGYDPHSAALFASQLIAEGVNAVEVPQSHKNMAPATREFKNLIVAGRLKHGDNPILRWNADNVRSKITPNGDERFYKGKSTGRIDGVVATVTAIARATLPGEGPSIYETRGVLTV